MKNLFLKTMMLIIMFASVESAFADDYCEKCEQVEPKISNVQGTTFSKIVELAKKAKLDASISIFDSYYFHEVDKSGKNLKINSFGMANMDWRTDNLFKVAYITDAIFGKKYLDLSNIDPEDRHYYEHFQNVIDKYPIATSYKDVQNLLKIAGKELNSKEFLLLMSNIGDKLFSGYDYRLPSGGISCDQIFENARNGGDQGGVCRHQHDCLAQLANAAGYKAVEFTGHWKIPGVLDGSHAIAAYQDPKTKNIYIQNYNQIISTNVKTASEAVDIGTRVLGPLQNASIVQSRADRTHSYQPRVSRWLKYMIEDKAFSKPDGLKTTLDVKPNEVSGSIEFGKNFGDKFFVKTFAIHKEANLPGEGKYTTGIFGASANFDWNKKRDSDVLQQIGFMANLHGGSLKIIDPIFDPNFSNYVNLPPDADRVSQRGGETFLGGQVRGTARIVGVDGKIEFKFFGGTGDLFSRSPRVPGPRTLPAEFNVGVSKDVGKVKVGVDRKIEETIDSTINNEGGFNYQTAYDKIDVVVDTRDGKSNTYMIVKGEVYAFEGFNKMSALGIKATIEASKDASKFGKFTVLADYSQVVSNNSNDFWYDYPASYGAKVKWNKGLGEKEKFGALNVDAQVRKNLPFYPFEDSKDMTPFIDSKQNNRATIWWSKSFGKKK